MNKTAFESMAGILDSFQSMTEREMKQALRSLVEATKREAIEKVKSAIYQIEQI